MSQEEQYLKDAKACFAAQQFSSASRYARKVIRRQPQNLDALLILAQLAFEANDFKDAESKFDTILLLSPNSVDALRGKLELLEVRQRYFEQIDILNCLINILLMNSSSTLNSVWQHCKPEIWSWQLRN